MSDRNAFSNLKILLVDDDEFTLDLNTRILSSLGCSNITTAMNGAVAIRELNESREPFDIVICDIMMPDMNGFDFIAEVGKWENTGGLIILSGEGRQVIGKARKLARKKKLHILGAIAKPLDKKVLRSMLNDYLRTYN